MAKKLFIIVTKKNKLCTKSSDYFTIRNAHSGPRMKYARPLRPPSNPPRFRPWISQKLEEQFALEEVGNWQVEVEVEVEVVIEAEVVAVVHDKPQFAEARTAAIFAEPVAKNAR